MMGDLFLVFYAKMGTAKLFWHKRTLRIGVNHREYSLEMASVLDRGSFKNSVEALDQGSML
jgi:hypothetical protein